MAASLSLTQLSSGNPAYEKYYRQVDPSGSGQVGAADAALFLKRSGLTDLILGKIWDLADSDCKGSLNKQQFFVALRLVACAQNGLEVSLKSLNTAVPPPKFNDTSSPLQFGPVPTDCPWVVKAEEKLKFDAIFESLSPVGGMLTGDKVKPVLLNSKLPVDVLGRVWELSDIDRDGMLDKDEFAVAMHLVYRALESEPVPMSLPATLIPPSKRKKIATPPVMPLLPSPAQHKERGSAHSGSKTLPAKPTPPQWVVSPAEKAKYDDLFTKTDSDMDGLVSGAEVRDIFLKTGLPSATLARIWELCDIGDIGKLSRDQFALALYLINQKLSKGVDPPQTLSPEMIPPPDRLARQSNAATLQAADFSAIKELDSLTNEIMDLQKEKSVVEQDIKEREETIRQRNSEVQDLQEEVQKGSEELSRLQADRQEVQEKLERLDEQKRSLEEQLRLIQQQCGQENQLIQSLQVEHSEQEQRIGDYEEELSRAREELLQLQEETRQLGEKVQSARAQLCPLEDAVKESHTQIAQEQKRLAELKTEEREVTARLTWKILEEPVLVNGTAHSSEQPEQLQWPQPTAQLLEKPKEDKVQDEEEQSSVDEPQELRVTEEQPGSEAEEPSTSPEEQEPKADFYSSDLYNSGLSTASPTNMAWPQGNTESTTQANPEPEEEKEKAEEQPATSTPKAETVEPEKKEAAQQVTNPPSGPGLDFFHSDPFTDSDPFTEDPFSKVDIADPFGRDPFKGTDPFAADNFFKQSSAGFPSGDPFGSSDPFSATTGPKEPDPFTTRTSNAVTPDPFASGSGNIQDTDPFGSKIDALGDSDPFSSTGTGHDPFGGSDIPARDGPAAANDPFAPGGTTVATNSDPDPFSAVFGNETFGGGFADFSSLAKQSNGSDPFDSSTNKNLFKEDTQSDVPPALPPKTGTPTRPPPPPPGKRSNIHRSESSESFQRRGLFKAQGSGEFSSLPAKDSVPDPFAPSSPHQAPRDPNRFASFDKYPTEEDMIEWVKRESEREERERVARLTQQEQEDLELAIALSKSELS
ncbi:epidermal growth factor receptor substrate 15-like isoform X1 [Sinocyclocheilus rhinocerous]|uniref:epidermal growth factor receptor substrate 15-like isoform X1 n=1 Tax=Sinocyclocheilus rhinocerous TaxID=307959 RepID=UPI0007BA4575|nr:PREDICTED: epidermal growth factor receptor substrate 15-like isoform X1 [Sinocyclocheilus rhinocerous]